MNIPRDSNGVLDNTLNLIKLSIWGKGACSKIDEKVYEEMKNHTILALPTAILPKMDITSALQNKWHKAIMQQLAYYTQYKYEQSNLPISVPYVVLKGTSAAQYYPHTEYRAMGDIDIITRREDFSIACQELINNGYRVKKQLNREVGFVKNGIIIEVHRSFAALNDPNRANYLDDLIISNIGSTHVLPGLINGLVLLEHISQHLENGLGLRQIIDWMMFVDKCLPDEKWTEFNHMVKQIGLTKLAIVVTRMCELYLGLPTRKWCKDTDDDICYALLDYIYNSGNFGNKQNNDTGRSIQTIYNIYSISSFFKLLQKHGKMNWNLAQKYRLFHPFAWMYQLCHFINKGLRRNEAIAQFNNEYRKVVERKKLFSALGVKETSKGLAVYQNGKYRKKRWYKKD